MKYFFSFPAFVAYLGLLSGVGVSLLWFLRAADTVLIRVAEERASKKVSERTQGWDFWTVEIDSLAAELKDEKARLRKHSDQLDLRAARLAAEQRELEKLRTDVEAMRKEIADRVIEINTDELKNLRTLAQTYANLTPKGAVAIIREMDDVTVVKILSLMKSDVVAPIFEEMSKTAAIDAPLARRAATLSEKLRLMKANKPANSS
jgi:flagellar motility protein MotE (MotC chaperone)